MKSSILFRHYLVYYYEKRFCNGETYVITLPEYEKHIMLDTLRQVLDFKNKSNILISRIVRLTQEEVSFDKLSAS